MLLFAEKPELIRMGCLAQKYKMVGNLLKITQILLEIQGKLQTSQFCKFFRIDLFFSERASANGAKKD